MFSQLLCSYVLQPWECVGKWQRRENTCTSTTTVSATEFISIKEFTFTGIFYLWQHSRAYCLSKEWAMNWGIRKIRNNVRGLWKPKFTIGDPSWKWLQGETLHGQCVHTTTRSRCCGDRVGLGDELQVPQHGVSTFNVYDLINNKGRHLTQLWDLETLGIRDPIEKERKHKLAIQTQQHFVKIEQRLNDGRYEIKLLWLCGAKEKLPLNYFVSPTSEPNEGPSSKMISSDIWRVVPELDGRRNHRGGAINCKINWIFSHLIVQLWRHPVLQRRLDQFSTAQLKLKEDRP